MSAASLLMPQRHFALFSFVAAAFAIGTIVSAPPMMSEAARIEAGTTLLTTNCEFLPTGDISSCIVQR